MDNAVKSGQVRLRRADGSSSVAENVERILVGREHAVDSCALDASHEKLFYLYDDATGRPLGCGWGAQQIEENYPTIVGTTIVEAVG
jgi:hypothetical protein